MNSLPDIEEVKDRSIKKGNNAFRVYRMLPLSERPSKKGKDVYRLNKRTLSVRNSTILVFSFLPLSSLSRVEYLSTLDETILSLLALEKWLSRHQRQKRGLWYFDLISMRQRVSERMSCKNVHVSLSFRELIQNYLSVATGKKPKTEKEERVKHIKVIFGWLESPCCDRIVMVPVLSHQDLGGGFGLSPAIAFYMLLTSPLHGPTCRHKSTDTLPSPASQSKRCRWCHWSAELGSPMSQLQTPACI